MTCWRRELRRSFSWTTWRWENLIPNRQRQLCAASPWPARRLAAHCSVAKRPRCPMCTCQKHSILPERLSALSSEMRLLTDHPLLLATCCLACHRTACTLMATRWHDVFSRHFRSRQFFLSWASRWLMLCYVHIAATCAKYRHCASF